MRKIGIRDFQQHFHKEIKSLPFIVTKNGKDIFLVASIGFNQSPTISPLTEKTTLIEVQIPKNKNHCKFCGAMGADFHNYEYVDGTGEGKELFCDTCWKDYEHVHAPKSIDVSVREIKAPDFSFHGSFPKPQPKKKSTFRS